MIIEEAKSKQKGKMEIRSPKIKTTNSISHFTSVFQRSSPKETPNQRHVPRNNNHPKISSDNNHKNQFRISAIQIVIPLSPEKKILLISQIVFQRV